MRRIAMNRVVVGVLVVGTVMLGVFYALGAGQRERASSRQSLDRVEASRAQSSPTERVSKTTGSPEGGGRGATVDDRLRPHIASLLDTDEESTRIRVLEHFAKSTVSDVESGDMLNHPRGHFYPLKRLLMDPVQLNILDPERGRVTRRWDFLSRVSAVFHNRPVSADDKLKIGRAFLQATGVLDEAALLAIDSVPGVALEVARHEPALREARELRRNLGDGFSETQARAVAVSLRGIADGQSRIGSLARALTKPRELSASERRLLQRAFEDSTQAKRRSLEFILSADQITKLYDEGRYDTWPYWMRRLGGDG